jgi:hypothetical protein
LDFKKEIKKWKVDIDRKQTIRRLLEDKNSSSGRSNYNDEVHEGASAVSEDLDE